MKGPILCAALCAALFHGGCGENSTEHVPLMHEYTQEMEEQAVVPGMFRGPQELKEEQGGTHIFPHQPFKDEMRVQGKGGLGDTAEASAAANALRRAARKVPELAEALGSKNPSAAAARRQISRWREGSTRDEKAIYFHDENDSTTGFLSSFAQFKGDVTLSVSWLRKAVGAAANDSVGERVSFFCSEQIFMYLKALVMGDERSAHQIAQLTSDSGNAMDAKDLGRKVTPYDEKRWAGVRYTAMTVAAREKFGAFVGEELTEFGRRLLMTGNGLLVEASPNDQTWGIGVGAREGRAGAWQGLNLLGWVLMQVRAELRAELQGN